MARATGWRTVVWLVAAAGCTDTGRAPQVVCVAPIDRDQALIVVSGKRGLEVIRTGVAGSRLWSIDLGTEFKSGCSEILTVDDGRAVLWDWAVRIHSLADGSLRREIPVVPERAHAVGDHAPIRMNHQVSEDRLFVPLSGRERTWIAAYDATSGAEAWLLERPPMTDVELLGGGFLRVVTREPSPTSRPDMPLGRAERTLELVRAATGEVAWRVAHGGACLTDDRLVAATGRYTLAVWDIAAGAPGAPIAVEWPPEAAGIVHCHRRADRLWLVVRQANGRDYTILESDDAGLRPRHRLSFDGRLHAGHGRWAPLQGGADLDGDAGTVTGRGAGLFDVEAGRVAWVQDIAVDPTLYGYAETVAQSDMIYIRRARERMPDDDEIPTEQVMTFDPGTGEVLGAATIIGASLEAVQYGRMWYAGAPAPADGFTLVALDARTLQPVAPPGRGITVVDRTDVARSAWRPAAGDEGIGWRTQDLASAPP
jgi:hypothetical protein